MLINSISSFSNKKLVSFKNEQNVISLQELKQDGDTYFFENKNVKIAATAVTGATILGIIAIVAKKPVKTKTVTNLVDDIILTDKNKIKTLLSKFTHDDYDVSKNYKVNLHIHSTMSDGKMTPLEVLRQANERAAKLPDGEKFTFSLTDHDNIDGVKIIAEEIKKSPGKYSKLNFIPGMEMSVKYHNQALSKYPVEFDFLFYGFDINNAKLLEQIERRHSYLRRHTEEFFKELNAFCKSDLSVEKMQAETKNGHLKHLGSNGYLKALIEYTEDYCYENKLDTRGQIIEWIKKCFKHDSYAYDANIDLLKALKLSQDTNAVCSLAHPGKLNFNHIELKEDSLRLSDDIISTILKNGGDAIESHYMAYKNNNQEWWSKIRDSFKKMNLSYSRTGGYDCHGTSIYQKH